MGKRFLNPDNDINIIQLGLLFPEKFPQYASHIVAAHCSRRDLFPRDQTQPRPAKPIEPVIDSEILTRNPSAEIKNG